MKSAPKRSSFLLIFGLLWLLLSAPFVLFGWHMLQVDRRYDAEGITATAKVLSKRMTEKYDRKENRTDRSYYVKYEFALPSGQLQSNENGVDHEKYDAVQEGSPLEVLYLASEPQNSRVAGGSNTIGSYLMIAFGILGGVIGLVSLGIEMKARAKRHRIMRDGVMTEAVVESIDLSGVTVNDIEQLQIRYTYNDNRGQSRTGLSEHMSPEDAQQWPVGSKIQIQFNRERPEESICIG